MRSGPGDRKQSISIPCPERTFFFCSFTTILPCCSAAWPAPLPLSIVTAFLRLHCLCHLLPGLLRCLCLLLLPFWAWATLSAPLPLSTFTAFLGFYCLCRSAAWPAPLPLSTFTAFLGMGDFVDFYCLCRLLQPLSTFTAFVGLHCLCLILLSLSAILTLPTGCRNLLILSTVLLCNLTFGFLQTLSLYRDRSTLVRICMYICICIHTCVCIYIYIYMWSVYGPYIVIYGHVWS